jgi:hypothetical protein
MMVPGDVAAGKEVLVELLQARGGGEVIELDAHCLCVRARGGRQRKLGSSERREQQSAECSSEGRTTGGSWRLGFLGFRFYCRGP